MTHRPVRLAVRGVILHDNRLLLVNAWPGQQSELWCAPGGGVETGQSLPDNLAREVFEETGLTISVGAPVLVNEFHDPPRRFHQVDVYFRCSVVEARIDPDWRDPEGVVNRHCWASREQLGTLSVKPDSLAAVAWGDDAAIAYDPLELILR
jgi:8-oxo-dGTP diphosphatase